MPDNDDGNWDGMELSCSWATTVTTEQPTSQPTTTTINNRLSSHSLFLFLWAAALALWSCLSGAWKPAWFVAGSKGRLSWWSTTAHGSTCFIWLIKCSSSDSLDTLCWLLSRPQLHSWYLAQVYLNNKQTHQLFIIIIKLCVCSWASAWNALQLA